jgi:hypothetical protein
MRLSSWTNPRRDDREHEQRTEVIFKPLTINAVKFLPAVNS